MKHPDDDVGRVGDPSDDQEGRDDLPPHAHLGEDLISRFLSLKFVGKINGDFLIQYLFTLVQQSPSARC